MTVLLEGMSLVFENRVLNERYPSGVNGFRLMWDNGSFCTDGTISRLSFFESDDGFCTLMSLPSFGLEVSSRVATDVAVFMHGCRLWAPCLWLEASEEGDHHPCCWHFAEKRESRMSVPPYFQPGVGLSTRGHLDEREMRKTIMRDGEMNGVSLFRDLGTNKVFGGPGPLTRH
jgi:hypothetical protein